MSKIGEKAITIQNGVTVTQEGNVLKVVGLKGELSINLPSTITVENGNGSILVKRANNSKHVHALHGLFRSIIFNAVEGVVNPWKKTLEVVGTGYRVKPQGEDLLFELGYSHPIVFKRPSEIEFKIEGNNKVQIIGINKQKVGEVAFKIRSLRKPDSYKGKGIRYEGEVIKLKPGKKAKTA